jgi:hypothetical protein
MDSHIEKDISPILPCLPQFSGLQTLILIGEAMIHALKYLASKPVVFPKLRTYRLEDIA